MRQLALALMFLAAPLAAQDTPQLHTTAVVTLKNGRIQVFSSDSGGVRRIGVAAFAATVDTILKHPRGGLFWTPADLTAGYATGLLAGLSLLKTGDSIPDFTLTYPTGPARTAVIRCLVSTGCTLTVTNRDSTGATRAGSWTTSPRLPLVAIKGLLQAMRTAALHDSEAVYVWP